MSGPKISTAELQRRKVTELIQKENANLALLNSKIRLLNCTMCEFTKRKDAAIAEFNNLIEKCNNAQAKELYSLANMFESECSNLLNSASYRNIADVEAAIEKIRRSECISRFWDSVVESQKNIDKSTIAFITEVSSEQFSMDIEISDAASGISLVDYINKLENTFSDDERTWTERLLNQIDVLIAGNEFIDNDLDGLIEFRNKLIPTLNNQRIDKNEKDILVDVSNYVRRISKYVEMYHTYVTYAMELNLEINPITKFYTYDEIESEKNVLENNMTEFLSQGYIENAINEVMEKHGYLINDEVIAKGSVSNNNSNNIDNVYKKGETNIRFFSSSKGHTVMEIVGDCSSENEKKKRYDEQVAFCTLYPEIIEDLETYYGVTIKRKQDMSPQYTCKELEAKDGIKDVDQTESTKNRDIEQEKAIK